MRTPHGFNAQKYFPPEDFSADKYFASMEDTPVPESRETLDAQVGALERGKRDAVLVTDGAPMPEVPDGYAVTPTRQGRFIHDAESVQPEEVEKMAESNTHGALLRHVSPKTPDATVTVAAHDKEKELQTSLVPPRLVNQQKREMKRQFPAAKVEVGGPDLARRVLNERVTSTVTSVDEAPHASRLTPPAPGDSPRVVTEIALPPGVDSWSKVSPVALARLAVRQEGRKLKVPDEFVSAWLDREQQKGNLRLYDLNSGKDLKTEDVDVDPRTNKVRLYGESPFISQLREDYEKERTPSQEISDVWNDQKKTPGELALTVAGVAGRGVETGLRPFTAASAGLGELTRAQMGGARRLIGDKRGTVEIVKGIPATTLHTLKTGERERENVLTAGARRVAGGNLNPLVETATNIAGDELALLGGAAQMGRMGTTAARAADVALDAANIPRSLVTSGDVSAPARQGLVLSVLHPKIAARSMAKQIRAFADEGYADEVYESLTTGPKAKVREAAELFISRPSGGDVLRSEEVFMSRLAEDLPVAGRVVKASERAFSVYLDTLRAGVFDDLVRANPRMTPDDLKGVANFINVSTGRGNIPDFLAKRKMLIAASQVLFSPRLTISRFELPLTVLEAGTPAARKYVAQELVKVASAGVAFVGLARGAGFDVEADPRSADFGKLKVGNTRVDLLGGYSQSTRFIAQMISGQRKDSDGHVKKLEAGDLAKSYGVTDGRLAAAGQFARSKLSPQAALYVDLKTGRTYEDEPVTLRGKAKDLIVPLAWRDIEEAYRDSGLKGAAIGSTALFGAGVQTYTPRARVITGPQKQMIFGLSDRLKLNEDELSMGMFKKKVSELSTLEASQLIEKLKAKR
jgi:hypothetical protein